MTRRARSFVVLAIEVCLVAAMCASLVYFRLESRDFIAARPAASAPAPQ